MLILLDEVDVQDVEDVAGMAAWAAWIRYGAATDVGGAETPVYVYQEMQFQAA